MFHLLRCLCSDVAAELCGAPSQWGQEGPRLPPAPVGNVPPHPDRRRVPALDVHSRCSSRINFVPISCCLLGHYFFVVISFLVAERTVGFPCLPHSEEFQRGIWSWDDLFGSKCVCFPKQTGFPPQTRCHGEEGLFPRCAELAPPSSITDKPGPPTEGLAELSRRPSQGLAVVSASSCLHLLFSQEGAIHLLECFQLLERLNIQYTSGQDKSN